MTTGLLAELIRAHSWRVFMKIRGIDLLTGLRVGGETPGLGS
jgi:hypothetical protein